MGILDRPDRDDIRRGWRVISAGGSQLGEIHDFVADASGQVRYLVLRLAPNLADLYAQQNWPAPVRNEEALPGGIRRSDPAHRLHDVDPTSERRPTGERPTGIRQEADNHAGAERPPEGTPQAGHERHLLIPLDAVRANPQEEQVMVEGLRSGEVGDFPPYPGGPVTAELEAALRRWFDRGFVPGERREEAVPVGMGAGPSRSGRS
jgi:hypothetical protein